MRFSDGNAKRGKSILKTNGWDESAGEHYNCYLMPPLISMASTEAVEKQKRTGKELDGIEMRASQYPEVRRSTGV